MKEYLDQYKKSLTDAIWAIEEPEFAKAVEILRPAWFDDKQVFIMGNGGSAGTALETIILSSSVLYELIGPACAKLSLYLSHSYSNRLEDLTPEPEPDETGCPKSEVERLIERINAIQSELPAHRAVYYEDEKAFSDAAEEHYAALYRALPAERRKR